MEYPALTLNSTRANRIAATAGKASNFAIALGMFALALSWLLVFNALRVDWATNPQYSYGWFVPLLALGMFRLRWTTRPEPEPAAQAGLALAFGAASLALLLPIRLVEEANPEWRLIQWVHAAAMVLLTLCWLYYSGGPAWARHFAFVVCLLLVAVPWPVPLEIVFVQNLMQVVAAITVEAVGLFNIPAVQHGNIIQVSTGLVGVDEACSGVRSLQTALFVCLFLGELYRLSGSRRCLLVILGFVIAVICNIGRTCFLVCSAAQRGLEGMHLIHDAAGNLALVATLLAIAGVGLLLKPRRIVQESKPVPVSSRARPRVLSVRAVAVMLAWTATSEFATQLWYRLHEPSLKENARWTAVWPETPERAQAVPVDSAVVAMLRCNEAKAGTWQDGAGNDWQAFFFRWAPGRNSAQLASSHTPEICLRGIGYRLVSDLGIRNLPLPNLELPFHQYVFNKEQVQLHVFYCRWEDQRRVETSGPGPREDGSKMSRLAAVLAGRRHHGQQVLEVTVKGPDTSEEALAAFARALPGIVRQ
jgi:exosortase